MTLRRAIVLLVILALATLPAWGQQSASYRLNESSINAGGRPLNGAVASSPSFRITLDAVADAVPARGLASASFHEDTGFAATYPPPGEATNLRFSGRTSLAWDADRSTGTYNLYRDALDSLPGGYGTCLRAAIAGTTWADPATPPAGKGWFYLVTAENRLAEEGTKGYRSDGAERPNAAPCP